MSTGLHEVWTAGALVRRHMRAALDAAGVQWREHKGWTESQFVVTGTRSQLLHARGLVSDQIGERNVEPYGECES